MKKKTLFLLMAGSLLLMSSCTAEKDGRSIENSIVNSSHEESQTVLFTETKEIPPSEKGALEIEYKPVFVRTIEELIERIQNVRQGKEEDNRNKLSLINKLIVPDTAIEGYHLWGIQVNEYNVFYYYTPNNTTVEMGMIDYDRDYIITVCRPEYANQEDPLKPLSEQQQIKTPLNEDGYLHVASMRDLTFTYENTWISIRYPKGKTYQDIKPLCKAKTIEID